MSVLLIAGSPSERSRAAALLNATGRKLTLSGAQVNTLRVRDLNPQAVLLADFEHPSIVQAVARVAAAAIIVVATPVYKAAYSGILKSFLDLLSPTITSQVSYIMFAISSFNRSPCKA